MNFLKTEFTKEQFLGIPEFETKQEAPKDKSPFLLANSRLQTQKEFLLTVLEKLSKANAEDIKMWLETTQALKVSYYVRHKDGNISELGAHINAVKMVESMNLIPADVPAVLDLGPTTDSNLSFTLDTTANT